MDGSWTIAELAELAAGTLSAGDPGGQRPAQPNGRVRDVPNERLIRWYVTVGLVDPPLSRRGRVAWYGPRHLLQLVAIKRRQAEGRSLAEIQAELAGATDESLAAVARVPASGTATLAGASKTAARFWAQRPEPSAAAPARTRPVGEDRTRATPPDADRGDIGGGGWPRLVAGVRLAPGVTLLLDEAQRQPGLEDLAEIAGAAGPLLGVLADRGLRPADASASPTTTTPGSPPGDPNAPEGAERDHAHRAP